MNMEQKELVVITKILSLPSKYDNVRTAWYAVPRTEQTVEKLTDHLVNEESLLNMRTQFQETADEAFYSKGKSKKKVNKSNAQQNDNKRKGKCNFCHKLGHWARDCFKKKQQSQGQNQNHNKQGQSFMAEGNNSSWASTSS